MKLSWQGVIELLGSIRIMRVVVEDGGIHDKPTRIELNVRRRLAALRQVRTPDALRQLYAQPGWTAISQQSQSGLKNRVHETRSWHTSCILTWPHEPTMPRSPPPAGH